MPSTTPGPERDEELLHLARTDEGARKLAQFAFDADFAAEAAERLEPVPGYEAIRLLGEGASGSVYLATHPGTQQLVALKVFQRLGQAAANRAYREMEVLADLRLACVPVVRGYGQQQGRCFLATDYVEGERLDMHRRQHDLGLEARVSLLIALAEAVQAIHDRGVLHRDLKPGNIIIRPSGEPVIVDFGIARLLETGAAGSSTREGQPLGTPAFMSPEQARGEHAQVTVRSDVYSLGAIGYWLCSGKTPIDVDCSYAEALRRTVERQPRHLRELAPMLPSDLAAILYRAVQPRAEQRTPSASELAADLRAFQRGQPLAWTQPPWWRRSLYWLKTHRRFAAVLALCLVGYAAAALASAVAWERNARAEERQAHAAAIEQLLEERNDLLFDQQQYGRGWQKWYEGQFLETAQEQRLRLDRLLLLLERLHDAPTAVSDQDLETVRTMREEFQREYAALRAAIEHRP